MDRAQIEGDIKRVKKKRLIIHSVDITIEEYVVSTGKAV